MGYLLLAIASSALVSLVLRFSEKHVENNMGMFMSNYAVCLIMARLFMGNTKLFTTGSGVGLAVSLGILNGILFLVNFVLLQNNMRRNGVVLSSTFQRLGVLVPILMAMLVFREQPEVLQLIGMGLAVAAIVMIHFEKEEQSEGGQSQKIWLIVLLLCSGLTDSMANIYDKTASAAFEDHYLFYTFLAALLAAFFVSLKNKKKICGKDLWFGVLLGVPNYFSARFLLLSLGAVPAVVVYPVYSVATIIVISVASMLLFKERISRRKLAALGVILVALVLLNL